MSSFDESVQDALTTIRLVPRWQLAPAEWTAVEAALTKLASAISSRDARALARALVELEDHGPRRLAAIPSTAGPHHDESPPRPVLDLVNTLVHPAGGWAGNDLASSTPPAERSGT